MTDPTRAALERKLAQLVEDSQVFLCDLREHFAAEAEPVAEEEVRRTLAATFDMAAIYASRPNPYIVTITDEKRALEAAALIDRLSRSLADAKAEIAQLKAVIRRYADDYGTDEWIDPHLQAARDAALAPRKDTPQ